MIKAMAKSFSIVVIVTSLTSACGSTPQSLSTVKNIDGAIEIQNLETGACLDILGQRNENGNPVNFWGCHGQWSQRWYFQHLGSDHYKIRSEGGKCLDVSNGDHGDWARYQLWDCADTNNQVFRAQYNQGAMLINVATNKALTKYDGEVHQANPEFRGTQMFNFNRK